MSASDSTDSADASGAAPLSADLVAAAVAALSRADALLVTAGAGIGVDSGLPDFRGTDGFWRAYPALRHERFEFHEIASPQAFRARPQLAWGFYGHRLALYRSTVPHAGFAILRRWLDAMPNGGFVLTSNVDGQFQKAGFDPARIVEIHGSIHALQCLRPCSDDTWDAAPFIPTVDEAACRLVGEPPRCPHCGGLARPNILMFGDAGWLGARYAEQERALQQWIAQAGRVAVVEIGAGTAIPTVRMLSEQLGADVIRINAREAHARRADVIGLKGGALATLNALDAAWQHA
ncbi:SIR2 family NAD-dependent protein deacylase [Burkholderia multivorans]|uniref:SIR2 family NAD-dependent protein deacylase n=1 Tax=Burkholderia multivorans TaxID=87883 RepID=UPI000CFE70A8|nr:Sir2 family NAD-dependent protein deacetylase [Burkholderia multivorans]MBR7891804.1 NAD-dependent protein deacetylase [Burkholderia multivorans]MBR8451556.1 NAD-dependent protein deacetylase [Burkholderia multivorans]MBU9447941.1 NAD-dependent protein deacetylase [Burkholderia multivorans]MCL4645291.1 NAD-dependent protein deacetylase [Burkholderia multivorans]PRG41514.1 NAD-dependent protein deacetylase [Burkholderia multivorans]